MEGRTRIKLRIKSHALGVLTLRFAESLNVSSVVERRVRPAAVPARAQPEQRARQPAVAGRARFPADADHHLLGPPGAAEHSGRISRFLAKASRRLAGDRATTKQSAGRRAAGAAGAEVAVQQSQLLVSAEPGHRLRDGAHPYHRAGRSTAWSRREFSKRDRRAPRLAAPIENSTRVIPRADVFVRRAAAGPLSRHRDQPDDARRRRHRRARHRAGQDRRRPTCAARRRCSSRSIASTRPPRFRRSARATRCSSPSMRTAGRNRAAARRSGTAAEILRLYSGADRRRAVRRAHAGDGRRRCARRPRAGLLRDAQQPAAGHAVQLAQRSRVVPGLPRVLHGARARAPVVRPGRRLEELSRAVAERRLRAVLRRALRERAARRRRVPRRAAAVPPLGDRGFRSGPGVSRLSPRPHQGREPRLPRAGLQQGRRRCCTCCAG